MRNLNQHIIVISLLLHAFSFFLVPKVAASEHPDYWYKYGTKMLHARRCNFPEHSEYLGKLHIKFSESRNVYQRKDI